MTQVGLVYLRDLIPLLFHINLGQIKSTTSWIINFDAIGFPILCFQRSCYTHLFVQPKPSSLFSTIL